MENSTELQKPNVEAEVYNSNKKNVTEEKKKAQKLNCKGKRTVEKAKKGINAEKIIIGLKK